ncbi:MAG: PQQ-binding-like beta-propeller repeat protein [Gemmatimonadota bacterium]
MELTPRMEPRAVESTPFTEVWSRKAGRGFGGAVAQSDTVIYFGASDRHVIAVDLRNGAQRWSARMQGPLAEGVAIDSVRAYAVSERPDGRAYGIDLSRGTKSWDRQVGFPSSAPVLADGMLIISTRRGVVQGLQPSSGIVAWRRVLGVVRAPAYITSPGEIIIATTDSLFRIATATGKVLDRKRSPGAVLSGWASSAQFRIAGTTDSVVVGMLPDSLSVAWSVRLDAPVIGTPIVRGDTAYAITRVGSLYHIRLGGTPAAERILSLKTPFIASPVMFRDWIVAGSADGVLYGFNLDGSIAWQITIAGPIELSPLVLSDGFLAIGGRGDLHRYRL